MKIAVTAFLILTSGIIYSQNLKERIQGQWVCDKILDSKGSFPLGEFMRSGYLRYSFTGSKLVTSDSPFNVGSTLLVDYNGENSFLVYRENVNKKTAYHVKLLDNNNLVLTSIDEHGEPVDLTFNKLKKSFNEYPIDNGLIVIEHFKKIGEGKS